MNFVALCMLNLVFLNHLQEKKGLVYTQCVLAKGRCRSDILDCKHARTPNKFQKEAAQQVSPNVSHCHFTFYQWIYTYMPWVVSKLLELKCNWKVQNHTQGPQKETICYIQYYTFTYIFIPQEKLLVNYNIAQCMRSGHRNCSVTRREIPLF